MNISKTDPLTLIFEWELEKYSIAKAECMGEIIKKFESGIFPIFKFPFFFNLSKIFST